MSRLNSAVGLEDIDSKAVDPLGHGVQDFDWATVFKHLDKERLSTEDREKLIAALRTIIQWIVGQKTRKVSAVSAKLAGRRLFALAWVLRPDLFPETPSLRWLARKVGMKRSSFSKFTAAASRTFQVRNRASHSHAHNFREIRIDANLSPEHKAVIRSFCALVDIRAETNMIKTGRVEGAHWNAMKYLREEIGI